jgi:biopolymer transport protein ExbD
MDERPFETLNVIPLVDVMLVLLTMVLTTANFIATGRIPVSLPQASRSPVEKHQDKTIEIAANGDIFIDDAPVSQDAFESKLATLPPDTSFLIRADRNLAFQRFIDVADILKRLNFSKVAVQTQTVSK